MQGVIVFFLFYMLTFALCSAIVILLGADLVTGISATAAALGNVGPGFNQVGPMANFADLHPISRIVLTLRDVDRPARSDHRAGDPSTRSVARGPLVGDRPGRPLKAIHSALTLLEVLAVRDQPRAAAGLRATLSLKTPDALQVVAAASGGCSAFITNDHRLPKLPGLRILHLSDYAWAPATA